MGELQERLRALHVWPQSTADHYADTISPRFQQGLYEVGKVAHEAADELDRLTAENARLRAKLELTPENVERVVGSMRAWTTDKPDIRGEYTVFELGKPVAKFSNWDAAVDSMDIRNATAAIKALGDE